MTEKIWWTGLAIAVLGVVAFWIFGFKGNLNAAACSISVAGISAWAALAALGLQKLRKRNCSF